MARSCCGAGRFYGFGPGEASLGMHFLFLSLTLSYYIYILRQFWGSAAQEDGSCPPGSMNGLTSKAGGKAALPQGGRRVVVLYEWERRT